MASIIVQYDPLAYFYSKKESYGPELIKQKLKQSQLHEIIHEKRVDFRTKKEVGQNIELPFVCCSCLKLAVVNNPQFHYRNLDDPKR